MWNHVLCIIEACGAVSVIEKWTVVVAFDLYKYVQYFYLSPLSWT